MNTGTPWTNEQRELLKVLWPTSASAVEIGQQCGGKSKGQVIGLANRMKLGSKKPSPTVRMEAKANVRMPPLRLVVMEPAHEPEPETPKIVFVPDNPVTFENLDRNMCRWPIGDPVEESFRYCGCPSAGRPFCGEHEKVAYGERRTRSGRDLPPLRERRFR